MDEELAFLEAIKAAPSDDAPRLVYADWLLERGDARGELIVAQCMVSRLEAANQRGTAEYRRAAVAEAISVSNARSRWLRQLGIPEARCQLVHGLPYEVRARAEELVASWGAVRRFPLRTIELDGDGVDVATLARLSRLPDFSEVDAVRLRVDGATSYTLDARRLGDACDRAPFGAATGIFGPLAPIPPFDDICTGTQHFFRLDRSQHPAADRRLPASLQYYQVESSVWDARTVLDLLGPTRRSLASLDVRFEHDASFEPLFEGWRLADVRRLYLASVRRPEAANGSAAFAAADVGRSLRRFSCGMQLDDTLAKALVDAPLDELGVPAGGSLVALERLLEHPIGSLAVGGFASADLVDLLIAKAPPTLSSLFFYDIADADVPRLATPRLAHLTHLTFLESKRSTALLNAPELAEVPWISAGGRCAEMPWP